MTLPVDVQNHARMDIPKHRCGFTLVELVTVIAVLAITAALAAPTLLDAWRRAASLHAYHAASSTLALARVQAVTRGHPVTACPSTNGRSCSGGVDWSAGWIVFLDPRRGAQPESQSQVIEATPALYSSVSLRSSPGRTRIRYLPSGWAAGSNVRLSLCTHDASRLIGSIVVNNAGRVRTEQAKEPRPCPYAD